MNKGELVGFNFIAECCVSSVVVQTVEAVETVLEVEIDLAEELQEVGEIVEAFQVEELQEVAFPEVENLEGVATYLGVAFEIVVVDL